MIKQVAIVGGTHGDEFTGIYLLKKWQCQPQMIQRSSYTTSTVFGNPKAFANNCRYIDCDLNRRFTQRELEDPNLTNYEQSRAKALNQQLGPKGQAKTDFIIDLHTTTSNMGPTLILPQTGLIYRQLAAYVKQQMPSVTVFLDDQGLHPSEHYFLSTIATMSVLIEVGPVPQSVLRQDVFEQTEQMTYAILDFLQLYNSNQIPDLPAKCEGYRFVKSIKLPLDSHGQPTAMVHSHIQDNDFAALHPGQPLFRRLDGTDILFEGPEVVYPAFINEAAYYDNQLAMSLMQKVCFDISSGAEQLVNDTATA